ncbi:hypothetical protein F5Y06DRAFT_232656 [Hypoxylon sp. FL0890]|nr:hypothetical protein F5Y06DRAFT_232656 [Hypoxylon sp. FL0890]
MASPGPERSSSLFLSPPPRGSSLNWLVSSSTSQSQPTPIRQPTTRRMSPTRPSVTNANGEQHSQKRSSSLAGFFNKILPSNRPEQGGTRRTIDGTGDNGNDLNELTGWNLAKEKNPVRQTSTVVPDESNHRRVLSWSPQKGDSRFVENLPREPSREREEIQNIQDPEPLPPRKSEALTRAEVRELLKSKEETRRDRRSLKESGDWLGVQGADPYSGEYTVLTPTDTLSSDTTPNSTRNKLARLARKKKAARLEYEQIRLLEEQEKDKAKLAKEQAKLNKIERVKEELRRQHQFTKWSQHKRQWSSAAEPNLSPIAQSLDSVALGSSETSSLLSSELSTDSLSSDPDDPTTCIPNFSRPTRPPVSTKAAQAERLSRDSSRGQGQRRFDKSTDTVIHNSPDVNFDPVSLTRPFSTQPSGTHLNAAQPELGRAKSERHFLWRRRRETGPGKSVSTPPVSFTMSMAAQNRMSNSSEDVQRDHFADLAIPDYHLHLLSPEPIDTADSQSTVSEDSPSTTINPSLLAAVGRNSMALASTTNLALCQGNGKNSQGGNAATVTSSQSKLKGIMKRSSIRLKLAPSLLTTTYAKGAERNHQRPPPTLDEVQDHTVNSPPEDTQVCQSQHQQQDPLGRISLERPERIPPLIGKKPARREFVSIPTTTTIGYAPDQQSQHGSLMSNEDVIPNQVDGAVNTMNAPPTPAFLDCHECCIATASMPETHRAPSPPTTLQNGLPKHEPVQETLGNDTISLHHMTLEKTPPTRVSTPTSPNLCRLFQLNLETKEADISKDSNTVEMETAKNQIPERTEANEMDIGEEKTRRISQEHPRSLARHPAVISQEAHRHLSTEEQEESIVESAAQIAVLRSRAKEVVRRKSADRNEALNSDHAPSPGKGKNHVTDDKMAGPKHLSQQRRPKRKRHNEEGAGTGLLSKNEHVGRTTAQAQSEKYTTDDFGSPETTITVVQFCKTAYILTLGLACTWWIMVRPAFDQRSDLWKRKHRKQSTCKDVAVFISAGMFCLAGAVGCCYALKMVWWIIE